MYLQKTHAPSFSYSKREILFSGIVTGSVVTNTVCPENYEIGTNSLEEPPPLSFS